MAYKHEYDLQNLFAQQPRLIKTPRLFDFDEEHIYAAMMDRLAQPLPNGEASPFSSRSPATGHGYLAGMFLHLLSMQAHEFNLVPDVVWLKLLQLLGTELSPAEYPLINITFTRTDDAIASNIPVTIYLGTEVQSIYKEGVSAYTTIEKTMTGTDASVTIPCRINQIGEMPVVREGEFSRLARMLAFTASAFNDGTVINPGRSKETLPEAALRVRERLKTGGRCLTLSDYVYWAYTLGKDLGILKATAVNGITYQTYGESRDLVTVMVYPGDNSETLYDMMEPLTPSQRRFDVVPANIIPLTGLIQVKGVETLSNNQIVDLATTAIIDEINPPYGLWGDREFVKTLSSAIERTQGIYAVGDISLRHGFTDEPLDSIEVQPWNLMQIQNTIQFEVLRGNRL
jgi:hypothetical protein